jgi:hypothetical protein
MNYFHARVARLQFELENAATSAVLLTEGEGKGGKES